jgi:hypothetical protein
LPDVSVCRGVKEQLAVHLRIALSGLMTLVATTFAQAASDDVDALLRSLIGKDETTIEQKFGLPDKIENNGVQTFLRYHNFDSWRTSSSPDPFGYSQGFSGPLGMRGKANFHCTTTLVFTDGTLRAYSRQGTDCRR